MYIRNSYLIKICAHGVNINIELKFNIDPIVNAMLISHECAGEKLKAYKTWNCLVYTVKFIKKVKEYD